MYSTERRERRTLRYSSPPLSRELQNTITWSTPSSPLRKSVSMSTRSPRTCRKWCWSDLGARCSPFSSTLTGSFRNLAASPSIAGGMVADHSSTVCSCSRQARMKSTSSMKPMSSISSASSRTTVRTCCRSIRVFQIRSMSRPGVATRMCTPWLSLLFWTPMSKPPKTAKGTTSVWRATSSISCTYCRASSRVGTRTRCCTTRALRVGHVNERDGAGRGLARSGLGQADHVAAPEDVGNGLLLDGRHVLVAHLAEGGQDLGLEVQVGEFQGWRVLLVVGRDGAQAGRSAGWAAGGTGGPAGRGKAR